MRTNQDDYAPGSLVVILGNGWQPAETVAIDVNDDDGRTWRIDTTVLADAAGAFRTEIVLPSRFVANYTVRATGSVSGVATWRFTDAIGTGPATNGQNGNPASSSLTLATPSSVAGRLLLATVVLDDLGGDALCAPSGWTLLSTTAGTGGPTMATYYRVATAAEPASYTWNFRLFAILCGIGFLATTHGAAGGIVAYAGVDTANASGPVVTVTGATATGTSIAAPSVASAAAGSIVVRAFGNDAGATTVTGTSSSTGVANAQVFSIVRAGPSTPAAAVTDADQATAGATGTVTATNGGTSSSWAAQTIVLRMLSTAPMIQLTIGDTTAQLGTNLSPLGGASNSTDTVAALVDGSGAGACYRWGGSVSVVSTASYDVKVTAATANARLDFLTASPTTYAACTGGEAVGTAMFPSASPAGAWATAQTATTGRAHPFWLGLDVRWTDAPSSTLGSATLTLSASLDW